MKTIAILNDVHDADYVVQHRAQFNTITLISTHAAVDDYMEVHGLFCISISSYLKPEEVSSFYKEAECVNSVLNELDKEFGNEINEVLGFKVPLRFFYALYRYRGKYEYTNLLKTKISFERILAEISPQRVILFQPNKVQNVVSFFSSRINIIELILANTSVLIEKITIPASQTLEKRAQNKNIFSKIFAEGFFSVLNRFQKNGVPDITPIAIQVNESQRWIVCVNGTQSLILLPNEVKSKFLKAVNLRKMFRGEEMPLPEKLVEARDEALKTLSNVNFDPPQIFTSIVLEDFCYMFGSYIAPVLNLHKLSQKEKIMGGVWVRPPAATNDLVLLVEYLLQNKLIVIGRQHGGNYGIEVSQPKHFDSDFWWSTHYLSYGFTKTDLAETSPSLQVQCEIIPVGEKVTITSTPFGREKIDILFPISNATSFYKEGVRPLVHELATYQRELLKFLNQLSGVRVVVKPFPGYNYATSAFVELLSSLKNIEILDLPFTTVLNKYEIGAIVSEFPSSPLYECLRSNAEILSLTNPLLPLNTTAQTLLEKRVYFYNSLPEIKLGIKELLNGFLPKRQDVAFVEKYLLPANPELIKETTKNIFGI